MVAVGSGPRAIASVATWRESDARLGERTSARAVGQPQPRRCRSASYRHTPAATETFRLSTAPAIGMRTSSSQVLRVSWRRPAPSAPSTRATGPRRSSVVERALGVVAGADDADVALLQLVQRARQVGDHQVGHRLGRAAGDLGHRGIQAHGVVLRRDDGVRAGTVGHAQAGAQVVRVGHAVEHQHQRRAAARASSTSSSEWRCASGVTRATTPWWRGCRPAGAGARRRCRSACAPASRARSTNWRMRASRRAGVDMDLDDGCGRGLQPHGDGMEAEQDLGAHRANASRRRGAARAPMLRRTIAPFTASGRSACDGSFSTRRAAWASPPSPATLPPSRDAGPAHAGRRPRPAGQQHALSAGRRGQPGARTAAEFFDHAEVQRCAPRRPRSSSSRHRSRTWTCCRPSPQLDELHSKLESRYKIYKLRDALAALDERL